MKNLIVNKLTTHRYFPVVLFIVSIIVSFGAFWYRDLFEGTRTLGLIGIFIINLVSSATFFVSGPAFLTVIAGGSIYPPLLVAIVASLGASVGDLVSFVFGYSSRHVALKKLENKPWFIWVDGMFKKYGIWLILIFAFIPNPFFDAIGLVAGIFKFKWKTFFVLTLIGRFARFVILALLGAKFA